MKESRLLAVSARLFLGIAEQEEALECLGAPLDWDVVCDLASREGMSGILAVQLELVARAHRLELPLQPFSRALQGTFAANGALFAELLALRRALQEDGARILLLKGGALTTTAYGGQLGLRPLSDLDLLVKESDLPVVRKALTAIGFSCPTPSGTLFTKGAVMFDIHTDLVNASRIRRRALAFRFDPDAIWTKALALDPGEPTFLILSPGHQFLHLAVHALKHSFSRLIWILDLALVSRQLDWEELLLQAERTGTLRAVGYAVSVMERLLGIPIPPGVWVSLPPRNAAERKVVDAVVERRANEPAGELLVSFSIPSLTGRLAYLFEFTFPRRRVLSEAFPTTSPAWIYLQRMGQILRLAAIYLRGALGWQRPVELPTVASRSAVGS